MLQGFEKEIQSTRKLTQITIEIVYKGFLRGLICKNLNTKMRLKIAKKT